jgi:hypothetical protein
MRPFFKNYMRFQSRYWIFLFASIHFLLHVFIFAYSYSSIMGRFDSDEPASLIEKMCQLLVHILQFPIVTAFLATRPFGPIHSVLQYVPIILNSGLWGVVLWLLVRRYIKSSSKPDRESLSGR